MHLLMGWAGRSNISTTMIYAHVFEDDSDYHEVAERICSVQRREARKRGPPVGSERGWLVVGTKSWMRGDRTSAA